MNNVVLIGRLTADPEVRYTQSGTAITRFTLAVDRPVRATEEKQTDFIKVVVFGKQAESAGKYLSKGRQTSVQGRVQTGSYTDKDGRTVYTTEIIAERVEFLGSKEQATQREVSPDLAWANPEQFSMVDDDIMF